MAKNITLETSYERFLRTRAEEICQTYLGWAREIMSGEVTPNRVIQHLAEEKGISREGVRSILKRRGVYKSAKQPVMLQRTPPTQLSMNFGSETAKPSLI